MLTTHFFEKVEIFFPKSKKENRFWTFLKCPFLKKGNTFEKLVFFLFPAKVSCDYICVILFVNISYIVTNIELKYL